MRFPLRLRLTVAFAASMAVVLGAVGAFLYARLGTELLWATDAALASRADALASNLDQEGVSFGEGEAELIDPDEAFAQLIDRDGAVVESSSAVSSEPLLTAAELRNAHVPTFFEGSVPGVEGGARLLAVPVEGSGGGLFVVVGSSLEGLRRAQERLALLLAIGGPVALALTSAGGWVLAGAALRPVERMRREASAISLSDPDRRLPVPSTGDELERLGVTLNSMLGRLEEAFERERRFVDDASHELRTPLGILKAELDLASSKARTLAELQAALNSASEEADRLVRLAEDLLVLSRLHRGRLPLDRRDVSLRELVTEAGRPHEAGARAAGVQMDIRAPDEVVRVDPVRVRQALENLIANAVRHAGSGGSVAVEASQATGEVRFDVSDSGPGFPEDFLEHAFEPFARGGAAPDAGASAAAGPAGAGLGLAIVRAVAESHGGEVSAENLPGGGARLTLVVRA